MLHPFLNIIYTILFVNLPSVIHFSFVVCIVISKELCILLFIFIQFIYLKKLVLITFSIVTTVLIYVEM